MLSWYENHYHYGGITDQASSIQKKIQLNGNVVTLSFLKSIKIIEDNRVANDFRTFVRNGAKNLGEERQGEKSDLTLSSVFTLALLNKVHEICDCGLPSNLMIHGNELCGYFFSRWHPKERGLARKQFPSSDWKPFRKGDHTRADDHSS
jgi:hypothetical protein